MKSIRNFYAVLACAVCCAAGVAAFQGCSTVSPEIVVPQQASYSGATRNSGIIQLTNAGWIVDGNFRARYNALIAIYGAEYSLRKDEGISSLAVGATPDAERWLIDHRHFDLMGTMNVKKHSGIVPSK